MTLNAKLKKERTGLTASQYSKLQEWYVEEWMENMNYSDLEEYVYNSMMQDVEKQTEVEFLEDCKDFWHDDYDSRIKTLKEIEK